MTRKLYSSVNFEDNKPGLPLSSGTFGLRMAWDKRAVVKFREVINFTAFKDSHRP